MDPAKNQSHSFVVLLILLFAAFLFALYTFSYFDKPSILWRYFSPANSFTRSTANVKQNCTELLRTFLHGNSSFTQFHADQLDKTKFRFDSNLKLYRYDNQLIIWTYRIVPNKQPNMTSSNGYLIISK